jgi:NAD(P)-dependent dehydrogenase (short-subunit alcohol dehydrogenase family)
VVHGLDADGGADTVRSVRAAGRDSEYFGGDLRSEKACRALIRFVVERFGGVDILVNNAADTGRGDVEHIPVAR